MGDDPRRPASGLQDLLRRAASDPAFCEALVTRRALAADDAGITLTPSERSILVSIPETQLRGMTAGLEGVPLSDVGAHPASALDFSPSRGIRPGLNLAVAVTSAALVGGGVVGVGLLCSLGSRPDVPMQPTATPMFNEHAPDAASAPGDADPDADGGGESDAERASPGVRRE